MKLKYKLSKIANGRVDKKTLENCDNGAKATQDLLVRTAWLTNKLLVPIIWVMSRFYKRTINSEEIEYNFYLLS